MAIILVLINFKLKNAIMFAQALDKIKFMGVETLASYQNEQEKILSNNNQKKLI